MKIKRYRNYNDNFETKLYSFVATVLVLIVADMKCSRLSVLLVYATQRTENCVALTILIRRYQLVNDIRDRRSNACVHITQQSSRTELHFRHRVPYSFGWIASPATKDCLGWHWISWRLLREKKRSRVNIFYAQFCAYGEKKPLHGS